MAREVRGVLVAVVVAVANSPETYALHTAWACEWVVEGVGSV